MAASRGKKGSPAASAPAPATPDREILVFISKRDSTCGECGDKLGTGAWITLAGERGALCLACADLDHLVFLPRGDAALTRRSKKYSGLSAPVLKWSRARKRYERQGLLVEEAALERAEQECLADAPRREAQRERRAEREAVLDQAYVAQFAARVRELFPRCPRGREQVIAEHACQKYSGRVGRSASAKQLDVAAVHSAVRAHVRHAETDYDRRLMLGEERQEARAAVRGRIDAVLDDWARRS